ncbi:uncharacterized protein Dwil_GK26981 [Drosophila willistoni]|uniref:glycine, alanine and asparagine-rich protein n=1 Tax=Drosophila willistoni TaxID=7260 RepID=UPI0007327814|nr:glycine, alanine and asparagine-rich protein [Drosophila willistoni]KRF98109.1 uncharacterized protein Dwil_GK26981 [Drosophila willistoni]
MRIRGSSYLWLLLVLNIMNATNGYRMVKRHYQGQGPANLYADFASINTGAGGGRGVGAFKQEDCHLINAGEAAGVGGGGVGGAAGSSGAGSGQQQCSPGQEDPGRKCDVKQIFQPGDPKQKSSSIAIKAAQDARAASEAQAAAGLAAAQHIKQELAEKAFQSAKAAEAALTGKQMVVEQLEQEMNEASAVVEEESSSLQNTEMNMNAAVDAARAATQQFEALTELQKTAKDNLANIQTVAMGSQQEMASKTQLLEAAKNRVGLLQKQLQSAREDFEKTKQAAYKAACAAVEAKQKASSNATNFRLRRRSHRRGRRREEVTDERQGANAGQT